MEGITLHTRTPNQQIALRGVRLRSSVAALAERATIEQTFVNCEEQAIEAIYTFPLPEEAAVCHFEVITGDRVLTGVVEETGAAIEQYDAAIERGDAAYLLEQERPDVFTIRVGNINPKQAATIRLTYVRPLKVVDRQIRLAYPTTVAPRYVTATGSADPLDAEIDGDAVNPPQTLHVPYGMSVEIDLDLGPGVASIESPSHKIRTERGDNDDNDGNHRRRVTFVGNLTEMNRDFVLDIRMAKEQRAGVVVVKADPARGTERDHFLAVTFMPEFGVENLAAPEPAETLFVLDCSGSMAGDSTAQATKALELCLRSLGERDTFNICRFGSRFELMRPEPVRYSAETLRQALEYIRRDADLDGTELLPPLQAIFKAPPAVGHVRNIVLLTDGQVSNEPQCIALARKHRDRNRIFSFGIGAAASAHLVGGLARATGGAAEFISEGERIDEKVLRAFGRMASPMVGDVEIDWGGADVQTLAQIPPIFDGDAVAVYARALGSPPTEISLKCKRVGGAESGREIKWTLPVGHTIPDTAGIVSTMWARRAIQSFEEVNGVRRTSVRLREQQHDRERLIALSKQFNLVCSLTGFIAVEHRTLEERNDGAPALRRVPVMLAKGWGGMAMAAPRPRRILADHMSAAPAAIDALYESFGDSRTNEHCFEPPSVRRRMDSSIDRLRDSLDTSLDRSIDRSIDRAHQREYDSLDPSERPLMEMLNAILADAVRAAATAVEFEPEERYALAMMIADESRRSTHSIPPLFYQSLAEMIKRLAGIGVTAGTAQSPQAGTLTADIEGQRAMLPVRTTPTPNGDAIRIELPASQHGMMATIKRKLHNARVRVLDESKVDALLAMLACQTADGALEYWPREYANGGGNIEVSNELTILSGAGQRPIPSALIATALCLVSMQTTYSARRALCQRAHAKGCRYLAQQLGARIEDVTAVIDALARRLKCPGAPVS